MQPEVLVFINFWEISKSADEPSSPRNAPKSTAPPRPTAERVKFVYRHAGLACLGTTLTTAAARRDKEGKDRGWVADARLRSGAGTGSH